MTLFFFSDISWEGLHQRPQHLARRMAKDYRVIWIEPIVLSKKPSFELKEVSANLFTLSLPALPYNARQKWIKLLTYPLSNLAFIRWLLLKLQVLILRKVMSKLLISDEQYIFFYQNFHYINLVKSFKPKSVAFDYIDNAFGFIKLPKHITEDWKHTIKTADIITVTSSTLKKQIEGIRKDNVHLVSNGVEYNFFSVESPQATPQDLPKNKPIVGYVGAVYAWFDFEILNYLCQELPKYNFIIIGKEHPEIENEITRLKKYSNFFFLGFRNYQTIPQYLHGFSVAIIPFKRNILTEAVNPVKLYEYSAAGIPTVTTNFSNDLNEFKDLIFIAETKEKFKISLETAISKAGDTIFRHKLNEFAEQHDWDNKYRKIHNLLSTID
ncbi:MAG: glycosyltransferase [Bacteroidota bacterium]|nr:glycosyltransferase [Bacteroidota bacterium]